MYNRILNRPMFKLGGDTVTAQGTGITSGLDAPRQGYAHEPGHVTPLLKKTLPKKTLSEQLSGIDVGVSPEIRKRAFWSGIGQGFGSNPKTLGEALSGAVAARDQILGPEEAAAAKRKFELEKAGVIGEFERGTLIKLEDLKGEYRVQVANIAKEATATAQKIKNVKDKYTKDGVIDSSNSGYIREMEIINSGFNLEAAAFKVATSIIGSQTYPVDVKDKQAVSDFIQGIKALILSLRDEIRKEQATGGRVGYQFGTPNQGVQPMQTSLNVDETIQTPTGTVQEDVSVQEKTQPSINMPYEQFRAKMPAEVDDEIVQLIYFNEDAFADFAQITSQADVYAFNNKWGVSLVLPMDTETT